MAVVHFNKENFEEAVKGDKLVVADFFATWCGPCKMLSPIIEQIEAEMGERIVVGKVDIDECMEIAQSFGIMSVPTIILFKNGEEVNRAVGFRQKSQIEDMIKSNM